MTKLHFAPNLTLPDDAVTQRFAFLGRIGSGKTYAAMKLIELMLDAGAQVVAIDPVGKCYGLRVPGKGEAYDIPVFGGLHGDIPLEPTAGALMADVVVDRALSCVIDVSQFATDADKARFAAAFAERFFFRKKSAPGAVHIFLEECQEFIPQNPGRGEEMMLHHWTRMAKLGRNFGIGLSLASQRPQEVNKKVLNLTECLFAFQMRGSHERKAILEWITSKDSDKAILDELPKLGVGEAIVDSPQWLSTTKRVHAFEKRTADVSATPKLGESAKKEKPLSAVDLGALRDKMSETIERAKADDPKALRAEIATLKRQLAAPTRDGKTIVTHEAMVSQIDAAVASARAQWTRDMRTIDQTSVRKVGDAVAALRGAVDVLDGVRAMLETRVESSPASAAVVRRPIDRAIASRVPARAQSTLTALRADGDGSLAKGEKILMVAIAQYPEAERDQLTALTGYKRSTRDAYIQRLGIKGYVEVRGSAVCATQAGMDALGADYEPLPAGEALRGYWLNRLPDGEGKVFAVLIEANGDAVPRDAITELTGYKRSTRDAYIQRLAQRRIAEAVGRDGVRAPSILFEA